MTLTEQQQRELDDALKKTGGEMTGLQYGLYASGEETELLATYDTLKEARAALFERDEQAHLSGFTFVRNFIEPIAPNCAWCEATVDYAGDGVYVAPWGGPVKEWFCDDDCVREYCEEAGHPRVEDIFDGFERE